MNKLIVSLTGLCLASGMAAFAQEREEPAFTPSRDIAAWPAAEAMIAANDSDPTGTDEHSDDAAPDTNTAAETSATLSNASELTEMSADELEGMTVVTLTGEEIGEIDDVGESPDGRLATVEVGGFLGVGEKTIGIPLSEMQRSVSDEGSIRTSLTRSVIESHPELDDSSFTPEE